MSWKMFFILLIVNAVILYPVAQWVAKAPKIIKKPITKYVNVTPDDESVFGGIILQSDGSYIDQGYNGHTLKEICPKGITSLNLLSDNRPFFNCK